MLSNITNVLSIVSSHIYFPTPSNGLKDVASYLGFRWSKLLSTMAGKRRFGKAKFCLPDLEFVNRCAYFDYQRDRVYVRTKKRAGAAKSRPTLRGPRRVKVNKRVEVRCKRRPHCNSRRLSEGRVLSAHYRHEVLSKRREEVGDFLILVAVPLR
jgi:hypothetical protein